MASRYLRVLIRIVTRVRSVAQGRESSRDCDDQHQESISTPRCLNHLHGRSVLSGRDTARMPRFCRCIIWREAVERHEPNDGFLVFKRLLTDINPINF